MSDSALALILLAGFAGCSAGVQTGAGSPPPAATSQPAASADAAAGTAPGGGPRLIYRATLVLRVEDFAAAERRIGELVRVAGGYVVQFREDRSSGAQRGGSWTIRVPVPKFGKFVEEASQLGIAEHRESQASDVTEEYVDLEARLKNKQQLEARLLELVAKRGDEIKDVLALEAELSRVREEIERMQGRLRYLTDRIALTTVEITAYERLGYQPPLATTFAGRVRQTFEDSVHRLRQFGEAWVLVAVALAPWLLVLSFILTPLLWLARRRMRRLRAATA